MSQNPTPRFDFKAQQEAARERAKQGNQSIAVNVSGPGKPPAPASNPNTAYFHSSHATLTILDQNDQKAFFKNHFLVTDNKDFATHIRANYAKKKTGSIVIREVNYFFYDQSRIIQPQFEPLPDMHEDPQIPPEPQNQIPNPDKATPADVTTNSELAKDMKSI